MCAVTALVTALNVIGVRQGSRAVDVFTLAKLLPLLLLVALGLSRIRGEVMATQAVATPDWTQAVLLLVFAYGGFEAALIPAGEAKDPRRDSAFALLTALAVVATVYALVQLTVVGTVPRVAAVRAPVAAAFGALMGSGGLVFASLAAMISTYGWTVGGGAHLAPHPLFDGRAGRAARAAGPRPSPRFRTPGHFHLRGLGWRAGLRLPAASRPTPRASAIARLVTYALVCGSLLVFRRRAQMGSPGVRGPAGAAVAVTGMGFCACSSAPAPSPRPGYCSRSWPLASCWACPASGRRGGVIP
jgi:amino acid transporter